MVRNKFFPVVSSACLALTAFCAVAACPSVAVGEPPELPGEIVRKPELRGEIGAGFSSRDAIKSGDEAGSHARLNKKDEARSSARPLTGAELVVSENLDPDVAADLGRVLGLLKRYRGLELKSKVTARKTDAGFLLDYVNKHLGDPGSARQVDVAQAFFAALGAIPPDCDLKHVMRSYMVEEIAGLYDWETKTLFLAERVYGDLRSLTMAHELTHALQDQHFGLARFMSPKDGVSEPFAAAQALMEGDATLTMLQTKTGSVPHPAIAEMLVNSLMSILDMTDRMNELRIPPAIGELLLFPYQAGFRFVVSIINDGSGKWRDIDWMLQNPPLSTEQVIHPEKMRRPGDNDNAKVDYPMDVQIPGVSEFVAGASFHGTDIAGESNLTAIFRTVMPADQAAKAASGWDGDRFVTWRDADGQVGLLLASVWDSPLDAVEAAEGFKKLRVRPVAVVVSKDRVAAAWGRAVGNPEDVVKRIVSEMTLREIRSWDDWFGGPEAGANARPSALDNDARVKALPRADTSDNETRVKALPRVRTSDDDNQ